MNPLRQSIRVQTLDIVVDSEVVAVALQPHIAEINRRRFLPVLARVLEDFDKADTHTSIDRIDIDLGDLPIADFEAMAEAALHSAFRQAVDQALHDAREGTSTNQRTRPEAASRLELIELYLTQGTLPFWADTENLSFEGLFSHLAQIDPRGLAAVIGRLARHRQVLDRLALQLDAPGLETLLRLLAPEDGALILAYMSDLRQTHVVAPLTTVGEADFAHLLWVFVLTCVLRDPGSQFNRKSFVKSLLDDIAARDGVDEHDLLQTLQCGLRETQRRRSLASSLPAIVAELVREISDSTRHAGTLSLDLDGSTEGEHALAATDLGLLKFALARDHDESFGAGQSMEQLVDRLIVEEPDGLKMLLRRHEGRRHAVRHLVERLGEPVLRRLLAMIDAQHAGLIIAYLAALRGVHRRDVLLKWSDDRFARLLWILVLTYVLRDPGTPFNRKSFVRSILTGIADREIVAYVDLLTVLRRGLHQTEANPSSTSLLAVIDDLAGEIDLPAGQGVAGVSGSPGRDPLALFAHYLATGERWDGGVPDPHDLFHRAVAHDAAGTAFLLWRLARSPSMREALVQRLSPHIAAHEAALLFDPTMQAGSATRVFDRSSGEKAPDHAPSAAHSQGDWAALLDALGSSSTRVADGAAADIDRSRQTVRSDEPDQTSGQEIEGGDDPVWPQATFGPEGDPYDIVDMSYLVLLHGVPPWRALSRNASVTVERVLADLSELPLKHLRRIFTGEMNERLRLAERMMQRLPEDRIQAMLARLITQAPSGDDFRSALTRFTGEALSKPAFYARALLALLDQTPLDLQQAAAEPPSISASEPAASEDLAKWDLAALKSHLVGRLKSGATFGRGVPIGEILRVLVARDAGDAGRFLSVITDRPDILTALVQQIAPDLLQSLLTMLYPAEAATARASFNALAGKLPHRLSAERRHALHVRTVLYLLHGPPVDAFVWMLRHAGLASLPDGSPPPLRAPASVILPEAYVAAFETSWTRLAVNLAEPTPTNTRIAGEPSLHLRQAAIDWLQNVPTTAVRTSSQPYSLAPLSRDLVADTIERLVADNPASFAASLRQLATDSENRARWIEGLPESTLVRMMSVLAPGRQRWFLPIAETLVAAWHHVAPAGRRPVADRALVWSFLFEMLTVHGDRLTPDRFLRAFAERTAATDRTLAVQLFDHAGALARNAGHAGLVSIFARGPSWPLAERATRGNGAGSPRPANQRPRRGKTTFSTPSEDDGGGTPIYIANAGLVLTAPFLPHLFRTLDLLERADTGRQRLRDSACASRAAHLLQYIVDGRTDAPEPRLVLNKILSGAPVQAPIARTIEPTDAELALCESLLKAVIANWTIIKDTSIAGLRETFLRREGKLQRTDDGWKLRVQRKTVDVLVDQVPWNLAIIFPDWMPQPLHVTW